MKRSLYILVCLSLAALVFGIGCFEEQDPLRGQVTTGIPIPDEAITAVLEKHNVPAVSIAVIHSAKIDWARGYGVREAGTSDTIDTNTLFQAASISKPVAAAVALRMVEKGMLQLDADVSAQLVSWQIPQNTFTGNEPVTVRRLLSHMAGFSMHGVPEFRTTDTIPTLVQILDATWQGAADPVRIVQKPGSRYQYSGGGYIVLQVLMTDVSKGSFNALANELVLQPTGMASSTFDQPLFPEDSSRAASGHYTNGWPLPGLWHVLPEQAAGGLWTTPSDLASFLIAIWRSYNGEADAVMDQDLACQMLTRQMAEYGLGFSLPRAGVPRVQHGGGNTGYRCFMVLSIAGSPDGLVIMTNSDGGEPVIWEIFEHIAEAYGWDH